MAFIQISGALMVLSFFGQSRPPGHLRATSIPHYSCMSSYIQLLHFQANLVLATLSLIWLAANKDWQAINLHGNLLMKYFMVVGTTV